MRYGGLDASHPLEALLFGLAIVGAAFLLSWAAETAQLDISAGLAIAMLALIAVLPEYAVDFVFAWKGGESLRSSIRRVRRSADGDESPCSLALANMTGANRLLIGIGWTMVVFIAWYRLRARGDRRRAAVGRASLDREHSIEIAFLSVATLYSLTLPLKDSITLFDAASSSRSSSLYTIRVSRAPAEEPHLVGPARYVGTFTGGRRAHRDRDVRLRRGRDPARRRALRRSARRERAAARDQRVPARPVARAARVARRRSCSSRASTRGG